MKTSFFLTAFLFLYSIVATAQAPIHTFAPLPYAYDALEPYIDKATMEIHYDRHHRAYYNNFMAAIKGTALEQTPMKQIFASMSKQSTAVRNQGGGYWNHSFFWSCMAPGGGQPSGTLAAAIDRDFGSFDNFKKAFAEAGAKRFGSGWVWLIADAEGKLKVISTANQDNPLMDTEPVMGTPILCLDVWEHAYYLKYQNKRADYIAAFWNVVNWAAASGNYEAVGK